MTPLTRPRDTAAGDWFAAIADWLLNRAWLRVGGARLRLAEVEFYLNGPGHADPFGHRHPLQLERGRWYFHRAGGSYRGGSFKGVDLTFGDGESYGGVLLRGAEADGGPLIDGPSLLVDRLLAATGRPAVADLDGDNPMAVEAGELPRREVYRSARVGLTLKRAADHPTMAEYLFRPYRFLTTPRRTRKGRVLLVLALHRQGKSAEEIAALTGTGRAAVARHVEAFRAGVGDDPSDYFGKGLSAAGLCRLCGAVSSAGP